jgi:hypothetical protein
LPHLPLLEVRCFNESRIDKIPLLILLTLTTLEDVEGHKSKEKTPSLMQLLMTHSQLLEDSNVNPKLKIAEE